MAKYQQPAHLIDAENAGRSSTDWRYQLTTTTRLTIKIKTDPTNDVHPTSQPGQYTGSIANGRF